MTNILLLCRTLRYHKISQILFRLLKPLRRRYAASSNARLGEIDILPIFNIDQSDRQLFPWISSEAYTRIREQRFSYLNHEIQFSSSINWTIEVERLWTYNLNYFDFLWELIANNQDPCDDFAFGKRLILHWIGNNKCKYDLPWDPYPTSLRIVNWIYFMHFYWTFFNSRPEQKQVVLCSIVEQTEFLRKFMERDLMGNHLFENAKTLVLVGSLISCRYSRRWLVTGLKYIKRSIKNDFFQNGMHFERSPMYHRIVLIGLIEIYIVLSKTGKQVTGIRDLINKGVNISEKFGSTTIFSCLFHDSEAYQNMNKLHFHLRKDVLYGKCTFSGYWDLISKHVDEYTRVQDKSVHSSAISINKEAFYKLIGDSSNGLIIDYGVPYPKHLAAHSHCSLTNYELYFDKKNIVIDSGVYTYKAGNDRNTFRSNVAHNVLSIDRINQSEIWSSFRCGRRSKLILCEETRFANDVFVHVKFRDYKGNVYGRLFFFNNDAALVVIENILSKKPIKNMRSYVHLDPNVVCDLAKKTLNVGSHIYKLEYNDKHRIHVSNREAMPLRSVSPLFGKLVPRATLELEYNDENLMYYGIFKQHRNFKLYDNGITIFIENKGKTYQVNDGLSIKLRKD